ncbi:bifunctional adenosylcobinamide kinase/adenosylcobinamide-phosphate guanylyltransferase [Brevibacillus choshinensis]|uniref:bifunctional adenosylcobinamide kinase/adenosylcobinamide-phosphate guanylyltransferase n=1 Tax=Brevibacillus choshinensis TaxID=54911 RepID=UPI002E24FDA7|nr:bifunctional adenosylcobinamide kinase/adenosylcobinamide-phosphate guanylyltransferase [Brevibacillus choshinensis]MED4753365.1 bifunctional adenosylcobinamide kinase/adenosylcobinamide-phosphate guanylyltransferase [Brevibacillus choshinensis]
MSLILVTGGVRSGKSRFAEELAEKTSDSVIYVATGEAWDEEMTARIEHHQARRPASWGCVQVGGLLSGGRLSDSLTACASHEVVLVDCLSTWVSNRLMSVPEQEWRSEAITRDVLRDAQEWLSAIADAGHGQTVIAVTSEVGLGGVAMNRLGRWFADVLGDVNQLTAKQADTVYAVLSGIPWRIKG